MKNHRLVVSFDVQDEQGNSLINEDFANAQGILLTKEEAINFNLQFARILVGTFVNHLCASCLEGYYQNNPHLGVEVWRSKRELRFVKTPLEHYRHLHSEVKVTGKGNPYTYLPEGTILSGIWQPNPESEQGN